MDLLIFDFQSLYFSENTGLFEFLKISLIFSFIIFFFISESEFVAITIKYQQKKISFINQTSFSEPLENLEVYTSNNMNQFRPDLEYVEKDTIYT